EGHLRRVAADELHDLAVPQVDGGVEREGHSSVSRLWIETTNFTNCTKLGPLFVKFVQFVVG
ncbi:MAG TPA: hypothetical protein VHI93_03280, partial [Candidatus Thermoplasmatota archaeon]|nr:hypothetical protein [Candidatus Thermoplasmatota archaeon]